MTIIAVSGGREYNDANTLFNVMDSVHAIYKISLVIQGECHVGHGGADNMTRLWAKSRQINCLSVPAKSNKHGWPAAGPKRNEEMADLCFPDFRLSPDYWLLFPGGRGTESARNIAKANAVEVLEWHAFTAALATGEGVKS
jgi:hypothetical protein